MDKEFFDKEVEDALAVLRNGGIILYPTDTIWGVGCNATNEENESGRQKKRSKLSFSRMVLPKLMSPLKPLYSSLLKINACFIGGKKGNNS